ncbi:hypothetical protein Tco_0531757 [Tanacetum coccineum]
MTVPQALNQIGEDLLVNVEKHPVLEMIVDKSLEKLVDETLEMIEDESLDMIVDETLMIEDESFKMLIDDSPEMIKDESLNMIVDETLKIEDESLKMLVDETLKLDKYHLQTVIADFIIERLAKDEEKNVFWSINDEDRESQLNMKNTMYHSRRICYFLILRQDQDHCLNLKNTILVRLIDITVKQWLDLKFGYHKKVDKEIMEEVVSTWLVRSYRKQFEEYIGIKRRLENALWLNWTEELMKEVLKPMIELSDLKKEKVSEEKEITEIFRIETDIFDFETLLCKEFKEFNHLL